MNDTKTGQPPDDEQARQYARSIGYTDEQIARMTEQQLSLLLVHASTPRQSWWQGMRSSGLFEPKVLIAYAIVVVLVWVQFKRPPGTLLLAGIVLLLVNLVVRFGERYGKR